MSSFFNEILFRPLLNLLFLIYDFISSDLGVAIIILTIIIRFVLLPIFYKSAKDQTIMQKLAPRIREIQKTHKDDKQKQTQEMLAVYKEHKVNPFSSIGLLLIQLPILWTLYKLFLGGFGQDIISQLYSFVPQPTEINYHFLGLIALNEKNIILVLVAAVFQFLQTYFLMKVVQKNTTANASGSPAMEMAQKMSQRMMYVMPVVTVLILSGLPAAIALYWFTTSAFSVIQQLVINKRLAEKNKPELNNTYDQGRNVQGN
jgi:YidC/Oxa1 family membrane protein insertase